MDQLGTEMLLEPTDLDEKQEVANISVDDNDNMDDVEVEPDVRADDHQAMLAKHLPEPNDLEIEDYTTHTWQIDNWRGMNEREHGPVFTCSGQPFRVLFFPFGNSVEFASLYLENGFEDKAPDDWSVCVQFMLVLWNPKDPTIYMQHSAQHRFAPDEGDWGFTRFCEMRKLFAVPFEKKDRPLVEDEHANITAFVRVIKDPTGVLWHNFVNYDSKKETGMVGLRNQGATCYLNSLLQSLYFTTAFRKAVYQIPTDQEADRGNSAYALQKLFYKLQRENAAVSTNELTQSFGWESKQIFEQQDVQELSRILMEKLEERMKGTAAENALAKLFVGKMKTYISCINVKYESSRIEDFWDLQLNVRGFNNLDDAFKDYISVETLEGDNKYNAEGFGLQDAKKGVIFESFPPVLHLQLKRFEYDFERDMMMKVNDRYEFPEVLDVTPYLSETADSSQEWTYRLHGILVHSGDLNAGHYYAFIKPTKDEGYFKFDDDRVTRATKKEACDENFGGEYNQANGTVGQRNPYTNTYSRKRSMNAYMLVYIRESLVDEVLLSEQDVEPPPHLEQRISEERALLEKKRKDREEAHLYMTIHLAYQAQFVKYQGFDVVPWTSPDEATGPKVYRILRTTTLKDFVARVAEELSLKADLCRLWIMVNRQNSTVRPDQPLIYPDMSVEEASLKFSTKNSLFRVWLETTERDADGQPLWGTVGASIDGQPNNRMIVLFLKHFDMAEQTLYGAGHIYVGSQDKVMDLAPRIEKIMGWAPDSVSLRLWEEIKHNMIEPMKPKSTLAASELQDGDIVCFQRHPTEEETAAVRATGGYVDAKEFYDYLLNRITVKFAEKGGDPEATQFELMLSKRMTYDQLAAKVGEKVGCDPTHLRFYTVNATTLRPKAPVKRTTNITLAQILTPGYSGYGSAAGQSNDCLYYETMDMTLSEMEARKILRLTWLPEGVNKEEQLELLVPKQGTVADLYTELQKKLQNHKDTSSATPSTGSAPPIRIFEATSGKIGKVLSETSSVSSLTEYVPLYAERIPEEEQNPEEDDLIISAFHFDKEPSKPHGIPFHFLVKHGEVFKATKERLSKRTGIKGKLFQNIKFALVARSAFSKPEYLEDDDILSDKIESIEEMLGLDHVNKMRNPWSRNEALQIR